MVISSSYTLKQIADELGIDKMKIYRYIKKNSIEEQYTNGQTKHYSETVREIVIKAFSDIPTVRPFEQLERLEENKDIIDLLHSQLDQQNKELRVKNEQIGKKDSQIDKMQNLLDQQQQLSLQDKQLITELRQQLTLESLKEEMNTTETEEVVAEEEIVSVKPIEEQVSKWWKFWK